MEGSTAVAMGGAIREQVEDVVVRFAGDSGDGIQITGGQFTLTTALAGNDLSCLIRLNLSSCTAANISPSFTKQAALS